MTLRTASAVFCIAAIFLSATAEVQTTWYVDADGDPANGCTSWDDACPELQTGLSLATNGDQVWVAVGTYKPDYEVSTGQHTGDRFATFQLKTGVEIYGGFEGTEWMLGERAGFFDQTILTGDLGGDDVHEDFPDGPSLADNSYHVTRGGGTDHTAVLDGFVIKAGYANGPGFPSSVGGGMQCTGGSPTVNNCTFAFNSAFAGAGASIYDSNTRMVNCRFIGNRVITGHGGGGGGMVITGGNIPGDHQTLLINCLFSGNSASRGGGLYVCCSGISVLVNCAFSGNSARLAGGAIQVCCNTDITLGNSILWNNTAPIGEQIALRTFNGFPCSLTAAYCDVQGGEVGVLVDPGSTLNWGEGNIDAHPMFFDLENGDFHLLHGSPCIDAGNNLAVPEGVVTDLDRGPRFLDDPNAPDTGNPDPDAPELPIVDMGPYEFDPDDCNNNGTPDDEDLENGTSFDINDDGLPDECQLDCNDNGIPDVTDIADGSSTDCDRDGWPDECQIEIGSSVPGGPFYCDPILQSCDPDCNANGQPDACDMAGQDCGGEGIPDDCPENPGPVITVQPASQDAEPGDFIFFVVGADGLQLEYQWHKDGENLEDDGRIIGAQTASLIILNVEPADAGDYDCMVMDVLGDCALSNPATLTVTDSCPTDGDGRVTICHIPPGNPDNARTITVGVNAVPAHLAHGDSCGPCEDGDG